VVEHLPSKCKALSSNPVPPKKCDVVCVCVCVSVCKHIRTYTQPLKRSPATYYKIRVGEKTVSEIRHIS
jgi:hypothetical protein